MLLDRRRTVRVLQPPTNCSSYEKAKEKNHEAEEPGSIIGHDSISTGQSHERLRLKLMVVDHHNMQYMIILYE